MRFGAVGTVGFIVDATTLYFFVYFLDLNLYIGRIFSYGCAVSVTWLLNRHYTFRSSNKEKYREWASFALVNVGGGLLNYATYSLLVAQSVFFQEYPVFAVAIGSLAGMLVNFHFSRKIVFRPSQSD